MDGLIGWMRELQQFLRQPTHRIAVVSEIMRRVQRMGLRVSQKLHCIFDVRVQMLNLRAISDLVDPAQELRHVKRSRLARVSDSERPYSRGQLITLGHGYRSTLQPIPLINLV